MNKLIEVLKEEFSLKRCVLCDRFIPERIFLKSCICEICQIDLGAETKVQKNDHTINLKFISKCKERAEKLHFMLENSYYDDLGESVASIYSTFITRNYRPSQIDILLSHPIPFEEILALKPHFCEKIVKIIGRKLGIITHNDIFKISGNDYGVDLPESAEGKYILMIGVISDFDFSKRCLDMLEEHGISKLKMIALSGR